MSPLVPPPEEFSEIGGSPVHGLVENNDIEFPLSFHVLFEGTVDVDQAKLQDAVQSAHELMSEAECEFCDADESGSDLHSLLIGWGEHIVRIDFHDESLPSHELERCVNGAHYDDALKDRALSCKSFATLTYAGHRPAPLEQYVALSLVAGALTSLGGFVVANPEAKTSIPVAELTVDDGDLFRYLREMPLLFLYCGFIETIVPDDGGVWLSTHGAHAVGLPDLAIHSEQVEDSEKYFWLLENVLRYIRKMNILLKPSHTMQIGEGEFLRARFPDPAESFLESEGFLYVLELITPKEANWQDEDS